MAIVPGGKYLYQPYFAAYLSSGMISLALTSSASVPKPWLPSATSGAEPPPSPSWIVLRYPVRPKNLRLILTFG